MTATVVPMDTFTTDHCDSCGDADLTLVTVRRLYVTTPPPAASDSGSVGGMQPEPEPVVTAGDTEVWCEVCRIHYPHELIVNP
jgi:hypothetical protein